MREKQSELEQAWGKQWPLPSVGWLKRVDGFSVRFLVASLVLPWALAEIQKERLDAVVESRREKAGIKG